MTPRATLGLLAILVVATVVAVAARRRGRDTTVDFYLAGQRIGLVTNACAICGDYLSAASFLGVAAAVYASGLDGAWYATGFAAGFLPVLLFVAAPMRRLGHVSIPDFLGRRLRSETVRLVAVAVVELVIVAYLIPQAVGAGLIWELLVDRALPGLSPYATGVIVSSATVAVLVVVGGMRGTTWNQALQFVFLGAVVIWLAVTVVASGFDYGRTVSDLSGEALTTVPTVDSTAVSVVPSRLEPGTAARFGRPGARYDAIATLALLVTLVMGTAGLPHVMNRYFTSPSGRTARRTTVWVIGFAGGFYSLAVLLGTAARSLVAQHAGVTWVAELSVDGVLRVPEHALLVLGRLYGGLGGLGLVASAALAAMISTIGGLLLAGAASWGHDVYERHLRPHSTQEQAVRAGRIAVLLASGGAALIALAADPIRLSTSFPSVIAAMVTWAFALAGSALTPVLLLAIWWRRLSVRGAVAGMTTGAGLVLVSLLTGLMGASGDLRSVLLAPTLAVAPVVALVTVTISRRDRVEVDDDVWVRMHGTAAERQVRRLARVSVTEVPR